MTDTKQLGTEAQDGINRLYRRYAAWLDRRLRAHVDADAAADVVQETYIRAAPYAVDDIRHPKAFLLKIALNLVRDESRKEGRRRRDREFQRPAEAEAAPQFDQVLLEQVIRSMPQLYRDVFVLSRFGGMGCRHANCAPETLPVGETGVAKARADRPEGDRPTCTSLTPMTVMTIMAGAEGRGDRPVRRRSRFTLARARAAPLALRSRGLDLRAEQLLSLGHGVFKSTGKQSRVIGPRFQRAGGINQSERALAALTDRSFLRLWTWPNLWMKRNNELADVLVVFGDHVLIFSDKGAAYPQGDDPALNWTRYYRRAISQSAHQINRAEAWLAKHPDQVFLDAKLENRLPITLPPADRRVVHRICVAPAAANAARAEGRAGLRIVPGVVGNAERFATGRVEECDGWVHVFDRVTLDNVLTELSTAPDLIDYLGAKEAFVARGGLRSAPSESDLLAGYILNQRTFPAEGEPIDVAGDLWSGLAQHPQYQERQRRDRISVFWDRLIERIYDGIVAQDLERGNELGVDEFERILRAMAAEDRFNRRLLAQAIVQRIEGPGGATLIPSSAPDLTYLLLILPHPADESEFDYRHRRAQSLQLRMVAAKAAYPALRKVIGIGLGQADERGGAEDLAFVDTEFWGPEMIAHGQRIRDELHYFLDNRVILNRQIEDEFPDLD